MKRNALILVAALCVTAVAAQEESDFVFGENDSIAAADTPAIDPFAEAVENDVAADSAQYALLDSLGEEENDTIRRKLEIHPLRKGSYFQFGIGARHKRPTLHGGGWHANGAAVAHGQHWLHLLFPAVDGYRYRSACEPLRRNSQTRWRIWQGD